MSSRSLPISLDRFAEALQDLPSSSLPLKLAELLNSISHLESSNHQLQPFANEGDADCADAIRENLEVIERMKSRIDLIKREVQHRGLRWEHIGGSSERREVNGQHADNEGSTASEEPTGEVQAHGQTTETLNSSGSPGRRRNQGEGNGDGREGDGVDL